MTEGIHNGHRARMRKRCMEHGVASLADHELLEMLLYYCMPRKDTNAMAHKMLSEFRSVSAILSANPDDISKRCGISLNAAMLFVLISETHKRTIMEKWSAKPTLDTVVAAGEYSVSLLDGEKIEKFYVLCLDSQCRLIKSVLLSVGTVDISAVESRRVVEEVIRNNASVIVLAHNHPSGNLKPSFMDINTTSNVVKAMQTINVDVLDHIIVGDGGYTSLKKLGLIEKKDSMKNFKIGDV